MLSQIDSEEEKTKRISSYIIQKLGCINVYERNSPARDSSPTHLIVMVNGIIGSASDWRYAAKQFGKVHPNDVLVHCSEVNCSNLTFDGIDVMGNRLAEEVNSIIIRHPNLRKISLVGHSLGGLISRYAIAVLYQQQNVDESSAEKLKGSIAGLEPMNFITSATPHLGSRGHKQIPLFCGSYALEKVAMRASGVFGKTGKHLFLCDGDPPLLVRMSRDCEDLKFISALQLFKNRIVYANARYDQIVGWSSSSLRRRNELPKRRNLKRNTKYPSVINEESSKPNTEAVPLEVRLPEDPVKAMEETMIRGLSRMSWHRIDISFKGGLRDSSHTLRFRFKTGTYMPKE